MLLLSQTGFMAFGLLSSSRIASPVLGLVWFVRVHASVTPLPTAWRAPGSTRILLVNLPLPRYGPREAASFTDEVPSPPRRSLLR